MARNKENQTNIDNTDPANYPNGRIRNNSGSNDGTPVTEQVYGDMHETFARLMRKGNIEYNDQPDNVSNGYQYVDALQRLANKDDIVRNCTKVGTDTINFQALLDIYENNESSIFIANFASSPLLTKATCNTSGWQKNLIIDGHFIVNQRVRVIVTTSAVRVSGIYESNIIPDLLLRLQLMEGAITNYNLITAPLLGGALLLWERPANEIPEGWEDATEWKGRLPIGQDESQTEFAVLNTNGGAKSKTLSISEMPSHKHSLGAGGVVRSGGVNSNALTNKDNTGHTTVTETEAIGGGQSFSLLNPYRVVKYIRFVG